jgi:hypothetical protein
MNDAQKATSAVVKAGMDRVCRDFTDRVAPLGFRRTNSRGRTWIRRGTKLVACIYLHRSGSTYGAPRNNSVDIRVHFSTQLLDGSPGSPDQLLSDHVRDSQGYAYHLRFNALSWSTYDRCLEDLMRITHEHGLPWFGQHGA